MTKNATKSMPKSAQIGQKLANLQIKAANMRFLNNACIV